MADIQHTFRRALAFVLTFEGGWSDRPGDPGGATMKGITLATYSAWLGHAASKEELRTITGAAVEAIYRERYWVPPRCQDMPAAVAFAVFDAAVNMGVSTAAKLLQRAAVVKDDGIVGPITLRAVGEMHLRPLLSEFIALRGHRYGCLSTFPAFGKGWMRRLAACHDTALTMA